MTKPAATYTQIGCGLSLYAGKTRSYLIHKGIPFVERGPTLWDYLYAIPKRTGAAAVPVVITPEGEWLQDTSHIIDTLEARFPATPIVPSDPVMRFAAYLLELWGDEFLLPLAMYTRWSYPEENQPFFVAELGPSLLPGMPRRLQNLAARSFTRMLTGHAEKLGVCPEMAAVHDRFAQIQLDGLERHFRENDFLFGGRPSLGDYGLIGPLYAHLGRDPWSKRELIEPRPHLKAWIGRMFRPIASSTSVSALDRVQETLMPALRSIFDEMVPFIRACASEVRNLPPLQSTTNSAPRFLGMIEHPMAGSTLRRCALSYPVWMTQRLLAIYAQMPEPDRQAVQFWLKSVGGETVLELDLPPMGRVGLSALRLD
jgi:glutathione S-transferase